MGKSRIRGTFEEQQSIDAGVADDVEVGGGTAARRGMRMCSAKDSRGVQVRKRGGCLVPELPLFRAGYSKYGWGFRFVVGVYQERNHPID